MKRKHIILLIAALLLPAVFLGQVAPAGVSGAQGRGRGGGRGPAIVSPDITADGHVTFRLRAPQATAVSVAGIGASSLIMTKDEQGIWSVTTPDAVKPDIYPYTFDVDGARIPDPANVGTGWVSSPSSVLQVPGVPWSSTAGPHGAVAKHVYASEIIGGPETYFVYTPPGYDVKRRAPYPVLVVLHGLGDTAPDWLVQGGANLTLDALIAGGKAEPMIMISPTAYGAGGTRSGSGFPSFTKALVEEILPQVEKQYNASNKASDRAITGLSMGAAQSILLLNRTDQFAWIGSFSPGFDMYSAMTGNGGGRGVAGASGGPGAGRGGFVNGGPGGASGRGGGRGMRSPLADGILEASFPGVGAKVNSRIRLPCMSCGTADDHLTLMRQFRDFLTTKGVKITSYVEVSDMAHVWPFWRSQLAEFVPMLFKPAAK